MTGRIFDIKEFAVHDGPGARMTFFLKGCPLRCLWCHNPEGQEYAKEQMHRRNICKGCGSCMRDTLSPAYLAYGRDHTLCPTGALTLCGEDIESSELLSRVRSMKKLLEINQGGVTFSGGEPLAQWEFLRECLLLLREEGIHTAVETSGYASSSTFETIVDITDLVIMDIKIMDDALHREATGVSNKQILRNARYLMESGRDHLFRTPLIPRVTDTEENLSAIKEFIGSSPWEKLPSNTLAGAKYPMLQREFPMEKLEE